MPLNFRKLLLSTNCHQVRHNRYPKLCASFSSRSYWGHSKAAGTERQIQSRHLRALRDSCISSAVLTAAISHSIMMHTSPASSVNYFREYKIKNPKLSPIMRFNKVILIDVNGENLGEMDSGVAKGLAEGRGLEVQMVRAAGVPIGRGEKQEKSPYPVFKIVSQKSSYDDEKKKKKARKKNPQDIIKEVKIGTKITDHDLDIKMKKITSTLEKGNSVRIYVEVKTKGKWITPDVFEEELKKREQLLDSMTESLAGVGVREEEPKKSTAVRSLFRPVKTPLAVETSEEKL